MANSPLDLRNFNPSGIAPDPNDLTEEQRRLLQQMLNDLRMYEFKEQNPGVGDVVPKAPGGITGAAPPGPPPSPPPLPASQIPANPGSFGLPGQIASQGASQMGAGGSGGWLGTLKGLIPNSLEDVTGLAGIVTALAGGMRNGNGQASESAERMNQMTEQRMRRVDPLHQAVTQLAWGRLPINSRQGITPPTYQPLP